MERRYYYSSNLGVLQRRLEHQVTLPPITPPEEEGGRPPLSNVQSQRSSLEIEPDLQDEGSKVERALAKLSMASGGQLPL